MNVELTKRTEESIQIALSSGQFSTAEAFLEAAAKRLAESIAPDQSDEEKTVLEQLEKLGVVGVGEGPGDLSTNPKYMEGFGR